MNFDNLDGWIARQLEIALLFGIPLIDGQNEMLFHVRTSKTRLTFHFGRSSALI
jgi:hypothetical protein